MIYDDVKNASMPEKTELIEKYSQDTKFAYIVQLAYSQINVFPKVQPPFLTADEIQNVKSPDSFSELMFNLLKIREDTKNSAESDNRAMLLTSAFLAKNPDMTDIVLATISKNPFNIDDPSVLNEIYSPGILKNSAIIQPTGYRKDFWERHSAWLAFPIRKGVLIQIIKNGSYLEIFSKSGSPYRNLDNARTELENKFNWIDGIFDAQLYFKNDSGEEDMNMYFKEISKKDQIKNYNIEIHGYAPITEIYKFPSHKSMAYADRMSVFDALTQDFNVNSNGIRKVKPTRTVAPIKGTYAVAADVSYDKCKPKDFLNCNNID